MKIELDLVCLYDPKNPKLRNLHMTNGEATVTNSKKKEVGWIRGVVPIGLDIHVAKSGRTYTIPLMDLFEAVHEQDLALDRSPGAAVPEKAKARRKST